MRRILILTLIGILALPCLAEAKTYKKSTVVMDTVATITVEADSSEKAESAIDAAFNEIRRLEVLLSFWTDNSEIAAIYNNGGVKPVKVSPETLEVVKRALYISEKTGGAFDPTIGPVMRLWDFKKKIMPTKAQIKAKVGLVDYRKVGVNYMKSTVFLKTKGMSFDTGGIAKGFAADKAAEVLKREGIESGIVAIAGDIRCFGPKTWNIGIKNPRTTNNKNYLLAAVKLQNKAISTSGDYERYFIKDGVWYHHLLDPRTGMPARGIRSISVIADEAVLTDGFATGIFVMGPEKGAKLLEELGLDAVIVLDDGKVLVTKGLRGKIEFNK